MKKEYENPVIEITKFNVSDIVSASPPVATVDEDEGPIIP